jgi:hypothetical protein
MLSHHAVALFPLSELAAGVGRSSVSGSVASFPRQPAGKAHALQANYLRTANQHF